MAKPLTQRATLVTLKITGWTARTVDRKASADVAERAGAQGEVGDIGQYAKKLISPKNLKPIRALALAMRAKHYDLTMPWDDSGARVLTVPMIERYRKTLDPLMEQRIGAVNDLLEDYPTLVDEAKERLGELYNADDYPSVDQLRDKMSAAYHFDPMPDASNFVVDGLSDDAQEAIRKDMEEQIARKLAGTQSTLYRRLHEAIKLCSEKLTPDAETGETKAFRDSMLVNLRDLAETIPDMNITDDPMLAHTSSTVLELLEGVSADNLRKTKRSFDAAKTTVVRTGMADLERRFAGYFGEAGQ